jgi:hypothetical protein
MSNAERKVRAAAAKSKPTHADRLAMLEYDGNEIDY